MKKLILILTTALIGISTSYGQTHFMDNFDNDLNNWANVDNDGDGELWYQNNGYAISASYKGGAGGPGALTPDNIMTTTSAIDLSGIALSEKTYLTYRIVAADPSYSQEHYAAYLTTGNTVSDITAATPVKEETLPANMQSWAIKKIDVSAYNGQVVYLSFRHFDCTDMYYLLIDYVGVYTERVDFAIVGNNTVGFEKVGNQVTIKGTMKNIGGSSLVSFPISWTMGANTYDANVTISGLAYNQEKVFSHTMKLNVDAEQMYDFTMKVNVVGDINTANDEASGSVAGVSLTNGVQRAVVIEESTGTWCGWCPYGTYMMDYLSDTYPSTSLIPIAVHNGDPMTVYEYDRYLITSGAPSGHIDRKDLDEHPNDFENFYNINKTKITPVSVDLGSSFNETTRELSISTYATSTVQLKGDYRFAVVLIEDSVMGTNSEWNQINYLSSQSQNESLVQDGINWKNLPEEIPYTTYNNTFGGFHHVARAILGSYFGLENSLPSPINAQTEYTKSFTYTVPAEYNIEHMKLAAIVVEQSSGHIVNGFEAHIGTGTVTPNATTEIKSKRNVSIFPNPNNGVFTVSLNGSEHEYLKIEVINMLGQTVWTNQETINNATMRTINLSDLEKGVYSVIVKTSKEEYSSKVVLK